MKPRREKREKEAGGGRKEGMLERRE